MHRRTEELVKSNIPSLYERPFEDASVTHFPKNIANVIARGVNAHTVDVVGDPTVLLKQPATSISTSLQ